MVSAGEGEVEGFSSDPRDSLTIWSTSFPNLMIPSVPWVSMKPLGLVWFGLVWFGLVLLGLLEIGS